MNIYNKPIIAMLPIYIKDGCNCTEIITREGEIEIVNKTTRTFVRGYLEEKGININIMRNKYRKIFNRRNGIPILLNDMIIFIPIKIRKPIGKEDGSEGYISLAHISDVNQKKEFSQIILCNGVSIESPYSKKTIDNRILIAKYMKYNYKEEIEVFFKKI